MTPHFIPLGDYHDDNHGHDDEYDGDDGYDDDHDHDVYEDDNNYGGGRESTHSIPYSITLGDYDDVDIWIMTHTRVILKSLPL